MIHSQLNQAVARATGDDCGLINRLGFSLVEEQAPLTDADLEALVLDWDRIQAEVINSARRTEQSRPNVRRALSDRAIKLDKRTDPSGPRLRRGITTAH